MGKIVKFNPQGKMLEGINELCDAVTSTLGPEGTNVLMYRELNPPYSTKDGVTVAREIIFKDDLKHMGAELVKQASEETATQAGDGTTTTLVLAQSIINYALELIESGISPQKLTRALRARTKEIVESIQPELVCNDKNFLDIVEQVGTISANNDPEIGKIIRDAYAELGKDAILTVEASKTGETKVENVPGMKLDTGYLSDAFVTDEVSMTCELEKPVILVTDYEINDVLMIESFLKQAVTNQRNILIVCSGMNALTSSNLKKLANRTNLNFCAIKAPALHIRKQEILKDIAALTGGTYIGKSGAQTLSNIPVKAIGSAERVEVGRNKAVIIKGAGSQEEVDKRIASIDKSLEEVVTTDHVYYKQKLMERRAALTGGFGIIHVGGASETIVKELTDRVDDAIRATRCALADGVVYGGGYVYEQLSQTVDVKDPEGKILSRALKQPKEKIWSNAGYKPKGNYKSYLKKESVLDPVIVLRQALHNAVEVSILILMSRVAIYNERDKEFDGLTTLPFNPFEKEDDGAI